MQVEAKPRDQTPLLISHLRLRRWVGWLGVLLVPVLLAIAGPRESISAYYHSPARDVFVGVLALIAGLLAAYRGHDAGDRRCSGAAAAGLLLVAMCPVGSPLFGPVHTAGAVVFFGAVAALAWRFGFGGYRVRTFRGLAVGIAASLGAAVLCSVLGLPIVAPEAAGVVLFGAAWLVKGRAWEALVRP